MFPKRELGILRGALQGLIKVLEFIVQFVSRHVALKGVIRKAIFALKGLIGILRGLIKAFA